MSGVSYLKLVESIFNLQYSFFNPLTYEPDALAKVGR